MGLTVVVTLVILASITSGLGNGSRLASGSVGRTHGEERFQDPGPTPTFEPWEPAGQWGVRHGPDLAPLWTSAPDPVLLGVDALTLGLAGDGPPGLGGERDIARAVGEDCTMAQYDGERWTAADPGPDVCNGPRDYDFRDVHVLAEDNVWAVGRYTGGSGRDRDCVIEPPEDGRDVDNKEGCGMIAHFDGLEWTVLSNEAIGIRTLSPPLNALDFYFDEEEDAWFGWAVGDYAEGEASGGIIFEYVESDGAGSWSEPRGSNNLKADLTDVKFVSTDEAWVVGEHGLESWHRGRPGDGAPWGRNALSGADHLYALDLSGPLFGWDGGERGRLNRYDGNCHDDEPGTACWFDNMGFPIVASNGVSGVRPYTLDILLLTRGAGWLVGSPAGSMSTVAFLRPDEKWQMVDVVADPGTTLRAMARGSGGQLWAVGDEGVILEFVPEPTDAVPTTPPTESPTSEPSVTPTAGSTVTPTVEALPSATTAAPGTSTPTPGIEATPATSPTVKSSATPTLEISTVRTPTATDTATKVFLPLNIRRVRAP